MRLSLSSKDGGSNASTLPLQSDVLSDSNSFAETFFKLAEPSSAASPVGQVFSNKAFLAQKLGVSPFQFIQPKFPPNKPKNDSEEVISYLAIIGRW